MIPMPVFVGYHPREPVAYHVCCNSIIRNSSVPVAIIPLALNLLADYQETHADGSNDFIYSRFLVPHLMGFAGRAIYIDGDMIVLGDIAELFGLLRPGMDVAVVKHDYRTKMSRKYLGNKNEDYPRKNWSSVIVWDCAAMSNQQLTPEFVQSHPGSYLHRFSWLADDRIQELPREWNWLPDELGPNPQARLIHYTLGTPCFHDFADTEMSDQWHRELQLTTYCHQSHQDRR